MVLDALIDAARSHDAFFTRIIDMIPADLYKHSASADADNEENTKYYKHRKLPLTVDEKKRIGKQKVAEKYSGAAATIEKVSE
jgi:hypothetical protein